MSDTKTPAPVHATQPDLIEQVRTLYGCTNPINEDDCDRLEKLWGEVWDRIYEKEHSLSRLAAENARLRDALEALVKAHEWAVSNPDSPVSANINYGHVATDAREVLVSLTT